MTIGQCVCFELVTRDQGGAGAFYAELFGWRVDSVAVAGRDLYPALRNGDQAFGGLVALTGAGETPPYWLSYVACDDVERAAERATGMGGSVAMGPETIPGVGHF